MRALISRYTFSIKFNPAAGTTICVVASDGPGAPVSAGAHPMTRQDRPMTAKLSNFFIFAPLLFQDGVLNGSLNQQRHNREFLVSGEGIRGRQRSTPPTRNEQHHELRDTFRSVRRCIVSIERPTLVAQRIFGEYASRVRIPPTALFLLRNILPHRFHWLQPTTPAGRILCPATKRSLFIFDTICPNLTFKIVSK